MKKLLTTLHDHFCSPTTHKADEEEIADCYQQLKEILGGSERKLVLRIIDAKDRITESVSLNSFICGFRLAWILFSELNSLEQATPLPIGRDAHPHTTPIRQNPC